jgi:hypothetical protein
MELNTENLKNCILHIVRNGNLLSLAGEIGCLSFKDNFESSDLENLESVYKNFAINLESEILKGIEDYKNNI